MTRLESNPCPVVPLHESMREEGSGKEFRARGWTLIVMAHGSDGESVRFYAW